MVNEEMSEQSGGIGGGGDGSEGSGVRTEVVGLLSKVRSDMGTEVNKEVSARVSG